MDIANIPLIKNSFSKVYASKAELSERFYHHLFQAVPESKGLFKSDFFHQKEMFSSMLASTVRSMADLKTFTELGERLAQSHARFGVSPEQYQAAADALINALKDTLQDNFTAQEEAAWREAIETLTQQMARST